MSVNNESQNYTGGATIEKTLPQNGVYASLFNKINLTPVAEIGDLNGFEDNTVMAETSADARVTAAVQVFMQCLQKSGQKVEKLDKTLLDHHIAELDFQISRQLDKVMHSDEFQKTESVWRGLKSLVDKTDFRQNVKIEILDLSKDELRQDFEDSPEIIQSGLYRQTYTMEYDTPGGEPIAAVISAYEFDASAQDVALMRNISKVSAAAHMPFIGSAGPAFFLKENMEQVAAIKDIGNYFDRAEYIKWKSFRETDDSRYLGLVMPRVLGRLPYGPDTAFSGYQLLLEYFTFRDKFMFVHFNGLDGITPPAGTEYFDIEVVFSTPWPSDLPVTDDAVRLHCVPVINLFTLEADPLTITGLESEYLLRPKRLQDGHTEIYSVDSVTGSNRTNDAEYVPFSSFRHKGGMMRRQAPPRYYHTRVKRSVTGLYDTWLILGGHQWEDDRLLDREAVSLQITGTNGQLPRRALQSTLLDSCEQVVSTPLSVRNLCKPTLPVYPPAEDRFHWRVLSHLGSGFLNMLSTAEVLRGTLALYNWQEDELNTRRLEAIQHVEHHRLQRFEQGYLLRGLDIEVILDSNGFTGEGDIHLFGEMLNRFFALYVDMNQFNQLTLIVQPEGKCIRWKENHSPRLPG